MPANLENYPTHPRIKFGTGVFFIAHPESFRDALKK